MIKLIGLLGMSFEYYASIFDATTNNRCAAAKTNEGCCHEQAEIGAMPNELNAFQEHPFHLGKS